MHFQSIQQRLTPVQSPKPLARDTIDHPLSMSFPLHLHAPTSLMPTEDYLQSID